MVKIYRFQLTLDKNRGKPVIFSLPPTNQYQKISDLTIQSTNYQIITEKEWGNKVVYFTLNDVIQKPVIQFTTQPKNSKVSLNPHFTLADYSKPLIKSDRFINGKDKKIRDLAKKIVKKEDNLAKITHSLYNFTLDYLTYGRPIDNLYSYRQAMEERITDCGGFSTFLASLLQSFGIPSRLVIGFLIKENLFTKLFSNFDFCLLNFDFLLMHAWLELQFPDKTWFPLDPSKNQFGYIPADRLVMSYGEDFKLRIDGKIYQIDLLQKPIYL